MTQPNQSELEQMLIKLCWVTAPSSQADVDRVMAYITANYTPNSEVEQLKSRIAWLEGKIEGLSNDNLTPHLTPHLTPKKLPRFEP
jgi:hypothetical protein